MSLFELAALWTVSFCVLLLFAYARTGISIQVHVHIATKGQPQPNLSVPVHACMLHKSLLSV